MNFGQFIPAVKYNSDYDNLISIRSGCQTYEGALNDDWETGLISRIFPALLKIQQAYYDRSVIPVSTILPEVEEVRTLAKAFLDKHRKDADSGVRGPKFAK